MLFVEVTFECDECTARLRARVPLTGKKLSKMRMDVSAAECDAMPHGWWLDIHRKSNSYGSVGESEIQCACPKHIEKVRGW